jgi:hypothetical protein
MWSPCTPVGVLTLSEARLEPAFRQNPTRADLPSLAPHQTIFIADAERHLAPCSHGICDGAEVAHERAGACGALPV